MLLCTCYYLSKADNRISFLRMNKVLLCCIVLYCIIHNWPEGSTKAETCFKRWILSVLLQQHLSIIDNQLEGLAKAGTCLKPKHGFWWTAYWQGTRWQPTSEMPLPFFLLSPPPPPRTPLLPLPFVFQFRAAGTDPPPKRLQALPAEHRGWKNPMHAHTTNQRKGKAAVFKWWWSFLHKGGLSSGWSFIKVVFHLCGFSSGRSLIRVVFYQTGLLSV